MKLSEFDYNLPEGLIAQHPSKERQKCRLMVLDRAARNIADKIFEDITDYIEEGDCLVMNDTKVIPARLLGKRMTGGKVEIFLIEKKNPICEALLRPSARIKEGEGIALESGDEVEILGVGDIGRFVRFKRPIDKILAEAGHVPLPPYIDRKDEDIDKRDYQTVYARNEGATASPTAGLHFTEELLEKVRDKGCRTAFVTLHTNYGTFAPVKKDDIEDHKMHKEYFELSEETAEIVNETKARGGKIWAVGTTSARTLEWCALERSAFGPPDFSRAGPRLSAKKGYTDLFIYPGYKFNIVDRLITNFHLPKSTLLLLVSAFAGKDLIFEAYRRAVESKYRFFSYGDAMVIL